MLNNDRSTAAPKGRETPRSRLTERLNRGKILIILGGVMVFAGLVFCSTTMTTTTGSVVSEPIGFLTEGLWSISIGAVIGIRGAYHYINAVLEMGYAEDFI
tara:strand:- start:790 stop:1092 length:303 start_codon:yes stop_codon:yes gene_type:complete